MKQQKATRGKGLRQLAYLAGIIDGEGTIGIYNGRRNADYRLKLYVVNTDERLIKWLQDNFGGYVYSRLNPKHPTWKRKYEWHLTDDVYILKKIKNYLIIKKENAKLGIEFRKTFQKRKYHLTEKIIKKRNYFFEEMKKLNHRE